jgi:hypothetical protein
VDTYQFNPMNIRQSVEHLSWKTQMQLVVDAVMRQS